MPGLSIVVPFLGNVKLLEDTLVSVLENRPEACEVLVVLNEDYDDPYSLHGEVSFVASRPDAGLVGALYRGVVASKSPVVHILACGMAACQQWTAAAMPHFDDPHVGAVAPLVLQADRPDRVVSAGLAYHRNGRVRCLSEGRRAGKVVPHCGPFVPDIRAAFYRRSALLELDGWNRRATFGLAGTDLALALQHQGFRCILEPASCTFAQASLVAKHGAFQTGMDEARLFWRWASRYGWAGSVASHAALLVGECLGGLLWPPRVVRMAGRLAGGLLSAAGQDRPAEPTRVIPSPHFRCTAASSQPVMTTASRDSSASNFSEACSSGPAAPRRAPG